MKLNKNFPRKLYLDTKVLVNGKNKKPRDLNLEKYIELGEWLQDMINNELELPCNCDPSESTLPQACVKFVYKQDCLNNTEFFQIPCPDKGYFEQAISCSGDVLPEGCIKSYKVFRDNNLVYECDTIAEFNSYFTDPLNYAEFTEEEVPLSMRLKYSIVEYITCEEGSTQSLPVCFTAEYKILGGAGPMVVGYEPGLVGSCDCCDCELPVTVDRLFVFDDNGLAYQFLDVIHTCPHDVYNNVTLTIVDDTDLSGDRAVEVVNSPYFPHPIIKLTKPANSGQLQNIDTPESFTFKIEDSCGESNISTAKILNTAFHPDAEISDTLLA